MEESKNIGKALSQVSQLKPFKQGWVLWCKGQGYFKGLPLFARNPHILCNSPKDAQHFKTEQDAYNFKNMMVHSKESYQVLRITIQ